MIDIVHGQPLSPGAISSVVSQIKGQPIDGTLYLGYPVLSTVEENLILDALLVSKQHGVVAFAAESTTPPLNSPETFWSEVGERQDKLFFALQTHLSRFSSLRRGRELAVPLQVVSIFPGDISSPVVERLVAGPTTLSDALSHCREVDQKYLPALNAALESVTTIKPSKKRENVVRSNSRGAVLKYIEKQIANLDQYQKKAALECPEGPQRIRGLAGSGKTIALALKAAYLHARHPEWNIALTFYSRALYQQLRQLVDRFFRDKGTTDEPNFEKLQILHSWGGANSPGAYSLMAAAALCPVRDFGYAKSVFGWDKAFEGSCNELLTAVEHSSVTPIFDAVLIDEGQDLPPAFFRLIYHFTKEPKRIVVAYDELQNLSDRRGMPPFIDLFGMDRTGKPRVSLEDVDGEAKRDIILPVCYRNTPWALTVAHALGFGIYRKEGLVQHFDDLDLWEQIGYGIVSGKLEPGHSVVLKRRPESSPSFFAEHMRPEDAIKLMPSRDEDEQAEIVAEDIAKNIESEELDPDDHLVIFPYAISAKRLAIPIVAALQRRGVTSHVVGATSSQDEMTRRGSVAITHIHRAKGNEAPMVYLLNCQDCAQGHELSLTRNILFTAITRSRAWVRLLGWGPSMQLIADEVAAVQKANFQLEFKVPTAEELKRMRQIHRDLSASEKAKRQKNEKKFRELVEAMRAGELDVESLPDDLRPEAEAFLAAFQ